MDSDSWKEGQKIDTSDDGCSTVVEELSWQLIGFQFMLD